MGLVVQKYGGSSLADADRIRHVAKRVADAHATGDRVVAVVSAMGDTTDELIGIARQVTDRPDPRELDVLLSTGELVSSTLLAMALRSMGNKAISLSGAQAGIRTDRSYGKARIAGVAPERIESELKRGNIVVVAGFQGVTDQMDITTLGRGASDTTAVAIAASLGADRCEIYTDVEGIYTADPKQVPEARKLGEVGYEEMLELANYGAKMDPRSIELGMVHKVPILVASSFSDAPGTLIHGGADMGSMVREIRNKVRAIATDTGVATVTVRGLEDRPGIAAGLLGPLAEADISVDIIIQNAGVDGATDLTFTVTRAELPRALEITKGLASGVIVSADDLAKVSIVGTGMEDAPGYAARMFRALADRDINIVMINTSEISITCIVPESKVIEASRALHAAFELEKPD